MIEREFIKFISGTPIAIRTYNIDKYEPHYHDDCIELLFVLNGAGFAKGDTVRVGLFMFLAGLMAFLGQFWLRWYEQDWGPDDYDMLGESISKVQDILLWAGLAAIVIGAVIFFVGKKKDAPMPEKPVDMDALMNKYLNEEKHESFFED